MLSDFFVFSNMDEREVQAFSFLQLGNKMAQDKKKVISSFLYLLAASLLVAVIFFLVNIQLGKFVLLIGFLSIGSLYWNALKNRFAALTNLEMLMVTVLMATGILILLSGVFFFFQPHRFLSVFVAVCGFLLPFCVGMLWPLFKKMTETEVSLWYYANDLSLQKSTVFLNSIPIRFKVQLSEEEYQDHSISFRAPVRMKLGLIFYHMVQEQNANRKSDLTLTDENDQAYGWMFFTVSIGGWTKNLDPDSTLVENNIKQNTLIIARRMPVQNLLEDAGMQNKLSNNIL